MGSSKFAAYLGPQTRVATLIDEGSQSLMRHSPNHADGFGIGWYPGDGDPEPVSIVSRMPIWCEERLLEVPRRYRSGCIVASLREAPFGEPSSLSSSQPFQVGPYLFHFNGELSYYREVYERPLRNRLSDRAHRMLETSSPAELVFATWLDALGDRRGSEATANALEKMVDVVESIGAPAKAPATFAIVVADGTDLVALRTATEGSPPSMFTIVAEEGAVVPATGRVIASDPLFKGSWTQLEEHSLIIFATH
jgi:gamma-glutamyl hercynylcysteine S-oxide hydrolase